MTEQQMYRNVSWYDIAVPDLDAAQTFYSAVFGWTFQPFGDGYAVIQENGSGVGGLVKSDAEPGRGTMVYFSTDELETVLDRAVAAGGSVASPRTAISEDMGWSAAFTDPSGVGVGLWTMKPGP